MSKIQTLSEKEKILKEFNDGFKSVNEKESTNKEEYNEMKEIYDEIYSFYHEKIIEKHEIDIKYERIRLEKNLGKYHGDELNYNITFYITISSALIVLLLGNFFSKYNPLAQAFAIMIMITYITISSIKSINTIKPRNKMAYVSLKVLNDIEKEIEDKKAILRIEHYNSILEEIATGKINKNKKGGFFTNIFTKR